MGNQNVKQHQQQKKDRSPAKVAVKVTKQMVVFIVTAAMVICAVLAVVYRDRLNLDAIKRWVAYGSIAKDEEGQTEKFTFSSGNNNGFATLDGGLLMCSNHALQLYSSNGQEVVKKEVSMKKPVIFSAGSYAVVYDVGGSDLYVFHGTKEEFSYSTANGYALLSAKVNESGYLAVVEQTSGHKATVTVYNEQYQPQIGINESTNFVSDAIVSSDNQSVAVIELYQENAELSSDLVIYQLSDASVSSTSKLEGQVVIDLRWNDDRIWLEHESGVTVVNNEGDILNNWGDPNKHLERYSLDGDGFAVELMNKYKSGSAGELWVIDSEGQQSVSRSINEEVLSISAAGKYVAVLTTSSLVIYTSDLQEYATVANSFARRGIMRSDGSVMLIGTEEARLFVP